MRQPRPGYDPGARRLRRLEGTLTSGLGGSILPATANRCCLDTARATPATHRDRDPRQSQSRGGCLDSGLPGPTQPDSLWFGSLGAVRASGSTPEAKPATKQEPLLRNGRCPSSAVSGWRRWPILRINGHPASPGADTRGVRRGVAPVEPGPSVAHTVPCAHCEKFVTVSYGKGGNTL